MLLLALGVIASLIGYTYTQVVGGVDISKLPICAQGCLENSTGSAVGCAITDIHCLCSSIPYINALSCCLENACDPADQKAALAFDLGLCATYNVSIPDFLGCSPLTTAAALSIATPIIQATHAPQSSTTIISSFTVATVSTVTNIILAFTLTSGGPVATFTGQAILTGSCTIPAIASYSPIAGNIIEYPWVGCSPDSTGCCPFQFAEEGPLTVCPTDYFTTSSACCPSGWSVLPTPLFPNLTPCYTTPALPLVPPSADVSGASTSPTTISTQLFTLRYTLAPPPVAGIVVGAIVGIAVASGAAIIVIALCLYFWRRAHARKRDQARRDATVIRSPRPELSSMVYSPNSQHNSIPQSPGARSVKSIGGFSHHTTAYSLQTACGEGIPELPSPEAQSPSFRRATSYMSSGPAGGVSPPTRVETPEVQRLRTPPAIRPVMELPGSTYIHEHHPMYVAGHKERENEQDGEIGMGV